MSSKSLIFALILICITFEKVSAYGISPYRSIYPWGGRYIPYGGAAVYSDVCPVCDSSVYSYCTRKLNHDSCCCEDGYFGENSFECQYADCSYLFANSCQESELIERCCCEELYNSYDMFYRRFYNKK